MAAFSAPSWIQPSGLIFAISDSRAFMVATMRANARACAGISKSSPNCARTWARKDAIAEMVATARALSCNCGSGSVSQPGSGTHGRAGSPRRLSQADNDIGMFAPGRPRLTETLRLGRKADSGVAWQKHPMRISFSAPA